MSERSGPFPKDAPPRLAGWLAGLRLPASEREFQLGDLIEEFHSVVVPELGRRRACWWYWRQCLRILMGPSPGPEAEAAPPPGFGVKTGFWRTFRDIGFSLRLMRRRPFLAAASILTFALGIGANIAIFNLARPVLFDPLPFPDEAGLVSIFLTYRTDSGGTAYNLTSPANFEALRSAPAFESIEAFGRFRSEHNLTGNGDPRQVVTRAVTPGIFEVLGVRPILGRALLPADAKSELPLTVLSESLWTSDFSRDPNVLGRSIYLDGTRFQVVGVLPDWVGLATQPADAWTLLNLEEAIRSRVQAYYLELVGRLKSGTSLEAANQQLAAIMAEQARLYPETNANPPLSARGRPLRELLTGPVRPIFLILVGGALSVLLVAAVNLGALQSVVQGTRIRELAVRQAVGASRGGIFQLLLTDSLTRALLGGALGLFCAGITISTLQRLAPPDSWYAKASSSSSATLVMTLVLALAAGLAVGLLPAIRGACSPLLAAARSLPSGGTTVPWRGRTLLVTAQVALTVVLLIVAALAATSLIRVLNVDPGFSLEGLLVADFKLPEKRYDSAQASTAFYDELIEHLEKLPGATGACVLDDIPLDNEQGGMTWVPEGEAVERRVGSVLKVASPDCFKVLGIPVLSGRPFEVEAAEPGVMISRAMATALWPETADGVSPVGRRIRMGTSQGQLMVVAGVVGNIRNSALEDLYDRQVWLPHDLGMWKPKRMVVGIAGPENPERLAPAVRRIVRELDKDLALSNLRTMRSIVSQATASRRFVLVLLGGFSGIALILSALGIYAVVANLVSQRRSEIGLRMALGAKGPDVTRLVAGRVTIAVALGMLSGLGGALALSSYLASLLYETSARDVRIYFLVTLFVILIAATAAWSPTRRALRTDPLTALRTD